MKSIEDIQCEIFNFTIQAIEAQITVNSFQRGIETIISQPSVTELKRSVGLTTDAKVEEHEIDAFANLYLMFFMEERKKWIGEL